MITRWEGVLKSAKKSLFIAGSVLAATFLNASAFAAENCASNVASYKVSFPAEDAFSVSAEFQQPTSRLDLFWFPVAARPEGQSESVVDLKGFDADGNEVPLNYVGEGGWETPEKKKLSSISYRLLADHDEVNWGGVGAPGKDEVATHFDSSYFFAGHAFFLIDYEWPACAIDVTFDLPAAWSVTSPWPMQGDVATASGPWNLGQNVFSMGADKAITNSIGGRELTWLVADSLKDAKPDIERLFKVLPDVYAEFWGGADWDKYTVFFFGDDMTDGGAFQDSFAMRLATPLNEAEKVTWSHTLGHETMHLWNGAGPLRGENPDQTNWLTEGFTDYLTIKLMRQAGFLDDNMLQQRIANILRRFEIAKLMSPDVKLFEATKRRGENWFLIYGGGALTALLLDAELSAEDPDAFRNLMRDLYEHADKPYTIDRLMDRMNAASGGKAGELIAWMDTHPGAAEIRERLAGHGLQAAFFGVDEFYVRFPECGRRDCAPGFLKGPR